MMNDTKLLDTFLSPTFTWCFLLPLIHLFSLISNILCIIVFCSHIFIKKPIAIYFICLLMSDSITLFIGYAEMIDRELSMVDKSSKFCLFNDKIIGTLTEFVYTFMGRFCLEWMLYKVLWTRASTILLAILSVQRTRTFFSLSYHESRLCAFFAGIFSIIFAMTITCLEWTGIGCEKGRDPMIPYVFQSIVQNNFSRKFYSTSLHRYYNASLNDYSCMIEPFDVPLSINMTNQLNCSSTTVASQFQLFTTFLLSSRDLHIAETTTHILSNITSLNFNPSLVTDYISTFKTPGSVVKLFESRFCQITINYFLWERTWKFFNSVSFGFNRHTLAIFFGNALPSFIVVLANLLSIKVIYFSKSLKYLKQTSRKNRRKRRLQNDLRAFLVIIIESFKIIMISWGIPILLTMYHCNTLYVADINTCPKIKDYLVLFLYTDLFNSATNCLLYSLSGKLFRRRLTLILKTILVCGRGTLWSVKQNSLLRRNQPLDRQLSNNPSTNTNNNHHQFGIQTSRPDSQRQSERLSSPIMAHQNRKVNSSIKTTTTTTYNRVNENHRNASDDGSYSIGRTSDDHFGKRNSSSDIESDINRKSREMEPRKSSQSIGSFLLDKVRSLGSTSSTSSKATSVHRPSSRLTVDQPKVKSKKKFINSIISKRQTTTDVSFSSSSITGSVSHSSQRKQSLNHRYSITKGLLTHTIDNPGITRENIHENLTSL